MNKKWIPWIVVAVIVLGLYVAFQILWNTPLAPHMELDFNQRLLAPDYVRYWDYIYPMGVLALVEGLLITALLAVIAWLLWKGQKAVA
jgi:hypothetical protein